MNSKLFFAGIVCLVLLMGALNCYAENWVKISVDVPNQNRESNFYDSSSVKKHGKTLSWTEKFVLTSMGEKSYTKHLSQYPACLDNINKYGDVTYHKLGFEIKNGKFRTVFKRNYNNDDKLICTDKDMGTEFDKSWYDIEYGGPMYNRHYILVTKFKLGDI